MQEVNIDQRKALLAYDELKGKMFISAQCFFNYLYHLSSAVQTLRHMDEASRSQS